LQELTDDFAAVDATSSPGASLELGHQLKAAGKLAAARAAFEKAMRSTNDFERGTAALLLAELLNEQQDFPAATRAYEAAVASGHNEIVPVAAFGLGMLRRDAGDLEGALAAYRLTLDSEHLRFGGDAANAIGDLLAKRGDRAGARAAYERATSFRSDALAAARGRFRIAELDYKEGKRDAAMRVLKDLAQSAPRPVAAAVAFALGKHLAQQGKVEDARAAFQQVLASGERVWVDHVNRALRELRRH